jgi:SAM-dependent methyltransferase
MTSGHGHGGTHDHGTHGHDGTHDHGTDGGGTHDHGGTQGHEGGVPPELVRDEAFWDERYRSAGALWSGDANAQLVTEAAELTPGTALDVGCGEGADAIWLAGRDWQVTAVDISGVALGRAAAHAAKAGAAIAERITWQRADVNDWVPAAASFDLVSAQFMHLFTAQRELLHRRLAASVALGGTLLIVSHDLSDLQTSAARPPVPERYGTAPQIAATLDPARWTTLIARARPRPAVDPDGRTITIHDAVLKARRTA